MRIAHAMSAVCFAGILLTACKQSDPKPTQTTSTTATAQVTPEATRQPVSDVPDFKELVERGDKVRSPLDYDPDLTPETIYAAPTVPPTPTPLNRIQLEFAETYNDIPLTGYLSRLGGVEPKGCILLLHDWWGLTPGAREVADAFAREKYVVLALDLYGRTPEDRRAAQLALRELRDAPPMEQLRAAQAWLREQAVPGRAMPVGVVAYGMTTEWALALTAFEPRPAATVIHYGQLPTAEEDIRSIHGPLLGYFSDRDGWVTPEKVQAFDAALTSTGIVRELNVYGIDPGFGIDPETNDQKAYARETRKQIVEFFDRHLSAEAGLR